MGTPSGSGWTFTLTTPFPWASGGGPDAGSFSGGLGAKAFTVGPAWAVNPAAYGLGLGPWVIADVLPGSTPIVVDHTQFSNDVTWSPVPRPEGAYDTFSSVSVSATGVPWLVSDGWVYMNTRYPTQ